MLLKSGGHSLSFVACHVVCTLFGGPATAGATTGPGAAEQRNEVEGGPTAILSSGTAFVWNTTSVSYAGALEATSDVTPRYAYVGVPWYAAVTLSASVVGESSSLSQTATFAGGEEVALSGLNFAHGTAEVHYNGVAVSATFASDGAATAILPPAVSGDSSACAGATANVMGYLSVANFRSTGARCPAASVVVAPVVLARSLAERDVATGLIAHLPFYGDAVDISGAGNHGTVSGATLAANADNAIGQAYRFSSFGDFITVPGLTADAKSVALWIKFEEPAFPTFTFGTNSDALNEYLKCQDPDSGTTAKGVWQFLAGTFPSGASSITGSMVWVNGVVPSTAAAKEVISSLLHQVISTGRLGGNAAFIGTVDAFWAWSHGLCTVEVLRIYTSRGSALRFDGVDGGVTASIPVGTATANPGTSSFTLVAWVRPDSVVGRQTFLGQQLPATSTSPPLTSFALGVDGGVLSAAVRVECPAVSSCGCDQHREARHWRAALEAGRWAHVAAAYDGTSWTLFVDGVLRASVPFTGGSAFSSSGDGPTPVLIGAEGLTEGVAGGPSEKRAFRGLIASASVWSRALTLEDVITAMACSPADGAIGLLLHFELDEGVGSSGMNAVTTGAYDAVAVAVDTNAHPGANVWATTTCGKFTASGSNAEVTGTGVVQGIAGNCAVFSIVSRDLCSRRLRAGGDSYTIEILGPLHLHTELLVLAPGLMSPGGSVVDRGDGSYTVSYTRDIAGFYQVTVKLAGTTVGSPHKVYLHPFKASHVTSYAYDDPDGHSSNELEAAVAGRPASFLVQSVDPYGNILANGGLTAWSLDISGPEPIVGSYEDLSNGAYRFSYHPQVPGRYTMTLTLGGQPICFYGGKECCGAARSSLNACSTKRLPADSSGSCRFCLHVREDTSLNFGLLGVHLTLPHHTSREMSSSGLTISAWVRKPRATIGTAKEYIYSKRSPSSGKGYWLALLPTAASVDGTYELEGAVYVGSGGSETYRIVQGAATVLKDTWTHVAVTYSGTAMKLFVGDDMVKAIDYSSTQPTALYAVASSAAVTVGENFTGAIDNVKVFSIARANPGSLDSKCPSRVVAGGAAVDGQLQTYLRMNEGEGYTTVDTAGRATAATSIAVHGLRCIVLPDSTTSELRCPAGSVVSAIRFATYGVSSGSCGTYAPISSSCAVDVSYDVFRACEGEVACNLTATAASLGGNSPSAASSCGALSLTVEAVCVAVASTLSPWAESAAPTNVGVAAGTAASIVCPYDLKGTGRLSAAQESFVGNGTCVGWSLTSLTAGVATHVAIIAEDGCEYAHLPSSTTAVMASGTLAYGAVVDTSIGVAGGQPACPSTLPTRSLPPTSASSVWHGADGYCGVHADVHVLRVAPTVAGVAELSFSLGSANPFHSVTTQVGVDQGGMTADTTDIIGEGINAAEAGVPIEFLVAPADKYRNPVTPVHNSSAGLLDVIFSVERASVVSKAVRGANYAVTVLFQSAGVVNVTVVVSGASAQSMLVNVAPALPRKIVPRGATNPVTPSARSMHAASSAGADVFVFGGALVDGSYTNEMWRFHPSVEGDALWRWRHVVAVSGIAGSSHAVVSIEVDSGGAIAAGRMRADCADIRVIVTSSGADVAHFVEPAGAPSGCGSSSTLIWAKVTANTAGGASVDVLYGNTAAHTSMSSPTSVFTVFEDFESGTTGDSPGGWALDSGASVACGVPVPDATTFTISDDVALSGTKSLKVSGASKTGGGFKRDVAGMGNAFVLKGYLRDSACSGSFWISPDFTTCDASAGSAGGGGGSDKSTLPATARALGVHSCATPTHYAATYPWQASTVPRTGGWHSLAFYSGGSDNTTATVIDDIEIVQRTDGPITMDRVFLWGSKVPDALAASDVYWDAIFAAPWSPSVSSTVAAAEAVAWSPDMAWSKIGAVSPPSPRQGHSFTAVGAPGTETELIAFGGERSGHYFGDVWRYTVTSNSWEFRAARNSSAVVARAEHVAVVHDSTLVIFGGRGPAPKGDLWTLALGAPGLP